MSQNTEQNVRTREEQVEALAYQVFTGIMGATKKRHEFAVAHIQEAEARGAAEQRRKDAEGYLFDNPDTGTEYLPYHPIESGECQYAENIRKATNSELLSELNAAWTGWKEDREEKGRISANVAALEARVKVLEEALTEAASALEQVKDGERGGYRSRNGKFVSLQMSDGERADIIHSEVTAECEGALVTARAALTREGGV
ncbi:MAG: hypothetical protein ABF562_03265 [Gluconobacter japonicus]|uniref:hypothetical protein n=1 Tax=Gluconobacter japonicus TaxID=376620 RepID=UPI0039EC067C